MTARLAGQRIVVVGLGVGGNAVAHALLEMDAKVRVTEAASGPVVSQRAEALRREGAEVEIGGHDLDRLDGDLVVVSPGIPPTAPVVEAALRAGIEVISEIELAYRVGRCPFLAVTGTNGKTTTTSLLAAMLDAGGVPSVAAGNIGLPVMEAIGLVPDDGAIALEVSSFQLAYTSSFRPRVAIILNIAEDHTDWHGSVESYVAAKALITRNQTPSDILIVNARDPNAMAIADGSRARVVTFASEGNADYRVEGHTLVTPEGPLMSTSEVPLSGDAGIEDVLAASAGALSFGSVDRRALARAVTGFRPLSHRLEVVGERGGVTYIDDSKATNPHATLAAARGLDDVVLIAGGRAKGIDLTPLRAAVPPVRAVVALGESAAEVARVFGDLVPVEEVTTMEEAVRRAGAIAGGRGSVLLSPGCASLDMYDSYAQRGEDFARCVRALIAD